MNQETTKNPITELLAFIVFLVVLVPFSAYVFQTGWNMFAQPLTATRLSFWSAMGIASLIKFATVRIDQITSDASTVKVLITGLLYCAVTLGIFHLIYYFQQ